MSTQDDISRGCLLSAPAEETLRIDGRESYVEPQVLSASPSGDVLIAGAPNYVWERARRDAKPISRANSLLGAVIGRDGEARAISSPFNPQRLGDVRAFARDDGTWALVMVEGTPRGPGEMPRVVADRLWYGVLDGSRWTTLEHLPMPQEGIVREFSASSLVQQGDTTGWAVIIDTPEHERRIAFFERRGGRWTYQLLPIRNAAYSELAYSPMMGFVMAVVHPDPALRIDENSLFLFHRNPTWRPLRKVAPGLGQPVHGPSLAWGPYGGVLSWTALLPDPRGVRHEARATIGRIEEENEDVFVLDSTTADAFAYAPLPGGASLWVTDHVLPDGENRELRFLRHSEQGPAVIGRVANPFTGFFNAVAPSSSELLIAGPLLDTSEANPTLRTLLLRARTDCAAGGSPN